MLDKVAEFHGALTAATAASWAGRSKEASQIKTTKLQAQASKPHASDIKERFVATDAANAGDPGMLVAALRHPLPDAGNLIANAVPLPDDVTAPLSEMMPSNADLTAEPIACGGSFSSSHNSTSPAAKLASDISTTGRKMQQAVWTNLAAADSSEMIPENPAANGIDGFVADAAVSTPMRGSKQVAAIQGNELLPSTVTTTAPAISAVPSSTAEHAPPEFVAVPKSAPALSLTTQSVAPTTPVLEAAGVAALSTSQPIISKTVAMDQPGRLPQAGPNDSTSSVTKTAATDQIGANANNLDISNVSLPVSAADPRTIAAQQCATAIAQSLAASVSLSGLSAVRGSHLTAAILAIEVPLVGNVSDTIKDGATRPNSAGLKAKPTSGTTATANSFADGISINRQAENAPATAVSMMPKMLEAPGPANQGFTEPRNDVGNASLQQVTQAGTTGSANPVSQSGPSVNVSASSLALNIPLRSAQDGHAMAGVTSAQLIQSMRLSEMKLGMQSTEFGNISINTSLNHQELSTQISIDHPELGRALAIHLSAIEEKLGTTYGVQAKVELRDSSNPSPSHDSGYSNSGQQSREHRQSPGARATATQTATFERITVRSDVSPISITASALRLDITV